MRGRLKLILMAAISLSAACTKRDPVADDANAAANLPLVAHPVPDAHGAPPRNATEQASPLPPPVATIPAALQGRWGLTPADCTSTRGDAKGLLVVTPGELHFYESRAVPSGNMAGDPNSVSGSFAFKGEGQSWTRFQALTVRDGKLTRTESNPPASFTYAKC
jgi:hypothetical protein